MIIIPKKDWFRGKREDGTLTGGFMCPKCRRYGSLSDHTIKPDGTVEPSVVCGRDDCDSHDHVKLEGWYE